jgi:hypothetical protein
MMHTPFVDIAISLFNVFCRSFYSFFTFATFARYYDMQTIVSPLINKYFIAYKWRSNLENQLNLVHEISLKTLLEVGLAEDELRLWLVV